MQFSFTCLYSSASPQLIYLISTTRKRCLRMQDFSSCCCISEQIVLMKRLLQFPDTQEAVCSVGASRCFIHNFSQDNFLVARQDFTGWLQYVQSLFLTFFSFSWSGSVKLSLQYEYILEWRKNSDFWNYFWITVTTIPHLSIKIINL